MNEIAGASSNNASPSGARRERHVLTSVDWTVCQNYFASIKLNYHQKKNKCKTSNMIFGCGIVFFVS